MLPLKSQRLACTSPKAAVLQGPQTTCSFDGLKAGCSYRLRVRAQNSAGPGPYSSAVDFKTASDVPDPPGGPRVAGAAADMLLLEWDHTPHDGGMKLQSYHIEMSRGAIPCPPSATIRSQRWNACCMPVLSKSLLIITFTPRWQR